MKTTSHRVPGDIRVHGFISKPELQKLNRNSIFVFVNGRLIRDRLVQHALTEGYRNILPPTVFPVVLLFIELPNEEVDANVHPSKTEVRFRQHSLVHDFVRESVRAALMKARPVPEFTREITAQPTAVSGLSPGAAMTAAQAAAEGGFALQPPAQPPVNERLQFAGEADCRGSQHGRQRLWSGTRADHGAARYCERPADACGNVLHDERAGDRRPACAGQPEAAGTGARFVHPRRQP